MKHIYICDITLASILDSFGIPKRQPDPVTVEVRRREGDKDVTFTKWWYDITEDEHHDRAKWIMEAYDAARDWKEWRLDREHPLYWMKGFAENRAANLHLMHHGATPMTVIEQGDRTVIMGPRITKKDKETLKKLMT